MKITSMIFVAALIAACGQGNQGPVVQQTTAALTAEEAAVLALVNDQQHTTLEVLDVDCAIRSDSARKIIKHRDGKDGVPGTADDNLFDSLAELDDVKLVGPWTIDQLTVCADSFGYTPTPGELAMLELLGDVANVDFAVLDVTCGLQSDAAQNLIARRNGADGVPGTADDDLFHSADEVDGVAQVGPWNIGQLMTCAADLGYGDGAPLPDPNTCELVAWDGSSIDDILYFDENNMSAELATQKSELAPIAAQHADPQSNFPVRFGEVEVYMLGGEAVHYVFRFLQMLDPEGGIQLSIMIHTDSCFSMTDVDVGI